MQNGLTPTERIALLSIELTPHQTFKQLVESTGSKAPAVLRRALRFLMVAGLVESFGSGAESTYVRYDGNL